MSTFDKQPGIEFPEALRKLGFKDISCEELRGGAAQLRLDKTRTLTVFITEEMPEDRECLSPDGSDVITITAKGKAKLYNAYFPRFLVVLERYPVDGFNDPLEHELYKGESLPECLAAIKSAIEKVKS